LINFVFKIYLSNLLDDNLPMAILNEFVLLFHKLQSFYFYNCFNKKFLFILDEITDDFPNEISALNSNKFCVKYIMNLVYYFTQNLFQFNAELSFGKSAVISSMINKILN
jgi:hypothetical protein